MTTQTRPVLVVDGPSILHRAYHAYEQTNMRDTAGEPTWAIHGFFALLGGICDKTNPGGVAVGFDDDTNSERRKIYPEYKGQRSERSPDLKNQLARVQTMLEEMGVMVLRLPGWEADDVLASVARASDATSTPCIVATSDRDAFQLASSQVTVMRLVSGLDNAKMITPDVLHEMYGVYPTQYLDYAALRGDSSDNLPGVPGFGEKTAAKLLQSCTSVTAALADPEAATAAIGKSAAGKLVTGVDSYHRNVSIMAPHVRPINVACFGRPDADNVRRVLEAAGLTSTARRVPGLLGEQRNAPGPIDTAAQIEIPQQREYTPQPAVQQAEPVGAVGRTWGGIWNLTTPIPGTEQVWPKAL